MCYKKIEKTKKLRSKSGQKDISIYVLTGNLLLIIIKINLQVEVMLKTMEKTASFLGHVTSPFVINSLKKTL